MGIEYNHITTAKMATENALNNEVSNITKKINNLDKKYDKLIKRNMWLNKTHTKSMHKKFR